MELKYCFLLCATAACFSTTFAANTTYVCNADDTIDVSDLPEDFYYFAMQKVVNRSDVNCNVTSTSPTSIKITGCTKNAAILLTYSKYSGMEKHSLHGGRNLKAVKIICTEISASGEVVMINNTFAANLTIDDEAEVRPIYDVTSSLSTRYTTVGSNVSWTIFYPAAYIMEVLNCTAYAGTNDLSTDSVNLTSGCFYNEELITPFYYNLNGTANATLLAFKFYNYDDVFLKCDVKICPKDSLECHWLCPKPSRQGRDVGNPIGNDEYYIKEVHSILHVTDPNSSGVINVSPIILSMTLTFTLSFLVTKY